MLRLSGVESLDEGGVKPLVHAGFGSRAELHASSSALCCRHVRRGVCVFTMFFVLGYFSLLGLLSGRCFGVDVTVTSRLNDRSVGDPADVLAGVECGARL